MRLTEWTESKLSLHPPEDGTPGMKRITRTPTHLNKPFFYGAQARESIASIVEEANIILGLRNTSFK
jgi:hypothetical protein